jgi:hypothetical protein
MKPSKLQHRVTRTRVNGGKLLEFPRYCGPSGSGESWLAPKGPPAAHLRWPAAGPNSPPSARAQEGQLKSASRLGTLSLLADLALVCGCSVPTHEAERQQHTKPNFSNFEFPESAREYVPTCIYCRVETTGNEGVPHVIPEALSANDMTLPRGAECDKCNHYFGRTDAGETKFSGHSPQIETDDKGRCTIYLDVPADPEFKMLEFRRALYRITLSTVAMLHGAEYALDPRFDEVRRYIRNPKPGEAWPFAQGYTPAPAIPRSVHLPSLPRAPPR